MLERPSIENAPGVSEARLAQHVIGLANLKASDPSIAELDHVDDLINRPSTGVVVAKHDIKEVAYGDFGGAEDYTVHLVRSEEDGPFEVDAIERTR